MTREFGERQTEKLPYINDFTNGRDGENGNVKIETAEFPVLKTQQTETRKTKEFPTIRQDIKISLKEAETNFSQIMTTIRLIEFAYGKPVILKELRSPQDLEIDSFLHGTDITRALHAGSKDPNRQNTRIPPKKALSLVSDNELFQAAQNTHISTYRPYRKSPTPYIILAKREEDRCVISAVPTIKMSEYLLPFIPRLISNAIKEGVEMEKLKNILGEYIQKKLVFLIQTHRYNNTTPTIRIDPYTLTAELGDKNPEIRPVIENFEKEEMKKFFFNALFSLDNLPENFEKEVEEHLKGQINKSTDQWIKTSSGVYSLNYIRKSWGNKIETKNGTITENWTLNFVPPIRLEIRRVKPTTVD